MCGIYGMAGEVSEPLMEAMGQSLAHRGPDEAGRYVGDGVALGIRRLSIVDPAGGHQPVTNEDETLHAVFNGEIYNHRELRASLLAKGHRFRSRTDTEVIVHAYEEYGPECCRHFDGMFAFALWDEKRQTLFLARDRVGEKPLYYVQQGKRLLFGSELKALLQDAQLPRVLNPTALANYLSRLYVPGEDTIFQGLERLEPGHFLQFRQGECTRVCYWSPPFTPKTGQGESVLTASLRDLLTESVRRRLAPEGPTGLFLSGGLDSSAMLALALQCGGEVTTYAMGFEAQGTSVADERPFAAQLAAHFGTRHAEIVVTGSQVRDALPKILWHFDEPFSGALPQYFLSQRASADTKVVLSGLGGDELFGNYGRRFRLEKAMGYWRWIWDYVPPSLRPRQAVASTYAEWFGAFNSALRRDLLTPQVVSQVDDGKTTAALLAGYLERSQARSLGDSVFLMDFKTQLVSEYLNYSDVLSMAWGLECRAPFLSTPLIEFAGRLPSEMRNRPGEEKYLLRKVCQDILPPWILQRKKAGFTLPYASWMRGELKDMVIDYLSPGRLLREGYFRPAFVQRLLKEFYDGHRSEVTYQIWALLCFEIWHETVLEARPVHGPAPAASWTGALTARGDGV